MRNPEWSRDEVILCLEFYFRHYPNIPGVNSDEISQLSQETRQLCMKLIGDIPDSCRNNTSVHMKMRNFDHLNPEHTGKGLTNASKLNKLVFQELADDREKLFALAKKIKDSIANDEL